MSKEVIATISFVFDPIDPEEQRLVVDFTDVGKELLSACTDFELTVFAAQASLVLGRAIELPPSPTKP